MKHKFNFLLIIFIFFILNCTQQIFFEDTINIRKDNIIDKADYLIVNGDIIIPKENPDYQHVINNYILKKENKVQRNGLQKGNYLSDDGNVLKWNKYAQYNLFYKFKNNMGTEDFPDAIIKEVIKDALNEWMSAADIIFIETPYDSNAVITFEISDISSNGYDGYCYWWWSENYRLTRAKIQLDDNVLNTLTDLKDVAMHEIGHALGLGHEHQRADSPYNYNQGIDGKPYGPYDHLSIMNYARERKGILTLGDRFTVAHIYGRNPNPPKFEKITGYVYTEEKDEFISSYLPLYSLYNNQINNHLLTINEDHKNLAISLGYEIENITGYVSDNDSNGKVPLYRLYQPDIYDHHFTINEIERDEIVNNHGYIYEEIACYVYETEVNGTVPLYRLFSLENLDHFFTTDFTVADYYINYKNYILEGIACYIYPSNKIPLYRFFNLYCGDHLYTTNFLEKETAQNFNYIYEGIECYLYNIQVNGTIPLYRLYSKYTLDHFYTTDIYEIDLFVNLYGYKDEGIIGYISESKNQYTTPLYRWFIENIDHFYTIDPDDENL